MKKWLSVGSILIAVMTFFIAGAVTDRDYAYLNDPHLYMDAYRGFSFVGNESFRLDDTAIEQRVRFYNDETVIDIFYDDFSKELDNFQVYTGYSNKFFVNNPAFHVTETKDIKVGGKLAKLMKYHREKIQSIPHDKNFYASVEIKHTDKEVYTVLIKSVRKIDNVDEILRSFRIEKKRDVAAPRKTLGPVAKEFSQKTADFLKDRLMGDAPARFGIFDPGTVNKKYSNPHAIYKLDELEKRLDYKFDVSLLYKSISSVPGVQELKEAAENNRVIEYTFQTTTVNEYGYPEKDVTIDILNGKYDDLLLSHIRAIKESKQPLIFRINNEMNGDWCLYCSIYYGKDTDLYVELYRYIYRMFRAERADNVLFVFNPNERSFPKYAWNHAYCYYPGDEYVDIIGLTGYNTGTYYESEIWRGFDDIMRPIYESYEKKFSHPFIVTEFSSSSIGGDKLAWIRDMFDNLNKYPRVKYWVWWNGLDFDQNMNPARIYRIDESPEMLDLFKERLRNLKR